LSWVFKLIFNKQV